MKPCAKNKRPIAWLAAGLLDGNETEALRQHFERCPGCQAYWRSLSGLSEQLVQGSELPRAELPAAFHERVAQKIRGREKGRTVCHAPILRMFREWRLAALSAVVLLGVGILLWRHDPSDTRRGRPVQMTTIHSAPAPPTLAAYRRAAEISLENLDALLAKEVTRNASVSETFTVSSLLAQSLEK
jgi:hypothetical protein